MKKTNNTSILKQHGRTMAILALCLCLPYIAILFISNYVNKNIFFDQKENYLYAFTKVLDARLCEGGYDKILADAGLAKTADKDKLFADADKEAKTTETEIDEKFTGAAAAQILARVLRSGRFTESIKVYDFTDIAKVLSGIFERGGVTYTGAADILAGIFYNFRNDDFTYYDIAGIIAGVLKSAGLTDGAVNETLTGILKTFQDKDPDFKDADTAKVSVDTAQKLNERLLTPIDSDIAHVNKDALRLAKIKAWKVEALNAELRGITEDVAQSSEGLGVGYYSLELDAMLTYGPDADLGFNAGGSIGAAHVGRQVMEKGEPDVSRATQVRGNIMNAMTPIRRGEGASAKVIGYIWANELISELEKTLSSMTTTILLLLIASYAIMMLVIVMFFRQMFKSENRFKQELSKALEDAQAGTRAKSAFLASMSHEIRTPMNAIIGMAAIGKTSDAKERKDYAFDKIESSSKHLLEVINSVLDISKIESGKLELSPVTFRFSEMIKRINDVVSHRMEEKKQAFKIEVDPAIPDNLAADDQRLAQIIINLLSNACKFTPEGGTITLSARLEKRADMSAAIRVDVADTGIGITPEQQSRIFNAFEQAEGSTTRKYGGTGLGLSISKNIVELMGGRIWIESELGKGSVFSFVVTVGCLPEGKDAAERNGADGGEENLFSVDFSGKHILLAEDVEINREIVMTLLEPTNLSIDCAENGREAVRMFRENPEKYDLILMDVQMPEMDGYEATRLIRAMNIPTAASVPVIAATANVFKEDIDKCLDAGMNSHVGKPLNIDEVLRVLRKHLM